MTDHLGREINYMRLSLTDRCNLRCRYCMPGGAELCGHGDVLRYEEILRVCAVAVSLGIVNFKVTGGEPLVRRGCADFVAALKALPGVNRVTLTTNGLLLRENLDALCAAGIDGVNISIDTPDAGRYAALTGADGAGAAQALAAARECVSRGIKTKLNAVLLEETLEDVPALAMLARDLPLDVRFIELMPIGEGVNVCGVPMEAALAALKARWPDLRPVAEKRGNGPARYFKSDALTGRIGFIDAVSHAFCEDCNRVRLTATGILKPCLCYASGVSLREILRGGGGDERLRDVMRACIEAKPPAHCFSRSEGITERKTMNQIGG